MSDNTAKIGEKTVKLSQPYRAPLSKCIGRDTEMRKVLAAWMGATSGLPLSPLLIGEPGTGKNRIIYECAQMCGKELYIFQGHEDVTSSDLECAVRFSDDADRKMDYILTSVATGAMRGAVVFIDEIAKIRPRALAPLASLLDERRYIDSSLLGERIYAHPGFRFVAATNTTDLESRLLPDFIRSRMRPVISVGYPEHREIEQIIRARFRTMSNNGNSLLSQFWSLWKEKNGDQSPTPRDAIYIFGYALNLADFATIESQRPYSLEAGTHSGIIEAGHLEQAFAAFHDLPPSPGWRK